MNTRSEDDFVRNEFLVIAVKQRAIQKNSKNAIMNQLRT
jgi:hypothetical protein